MWATISSIGQRDDISSTIFSISSSSKVLLYEAFLHWNSKTIDNESKGIFRRVNNFLEDSLVLLPKSNLAFRLVLWSYFCPTFS